MKFLVVFGLVAIFAGQCFGRHSEEAEAMLTHNRVYKVPAFTSVCTECEALIRRVVDVANDPQKLAELKILLSALCHETSYAEECRLFVSKLDLFIEKLLPYLKDATKICQDIHLCSNSKIDLFHRVGLLYAKKYMNKIDGMKDLICEECQFAAHELQVVIKDPQTELELKKFIHENICSHLGQYQGSCDLLLEDFLPEFFRELNNILNNPKQFCEEVKLCHQSGIHYEPTQVNKNEENSTLEESSDEGKFMAQPYALARIAERLSVLPMESNEFRFPSVGCVACRIALETVLLHLCEPEISKFIADKFRQVACTLMPSHIVDGCEDFLTIYMPTIVKMSLAQLNVSQLCAQVRMCNAETFQLAMAINNEKTNELKCGTCSGISEALRVELASRELRKSLVRETKDYVCGSLPNAFRPSCMNITKRYVPLGLHRLMDALNSGRFCQVVASCQ